MERLRPPAAESPALKALKGALTCKELAKSGWSPVPLLQRRLQVSELGSPVCYKVPIQTCCVLLRPGQVTLADSCRQLQTCDRLGHRNGAAWHVGLCCRDQCERVDVGYGRQQAATASAGLEARASASHLPRVRNIRWQSNAQVHTHAPLLSDDLLANTSAHFRCLLGRKRKPRAA